MLVAGGMFLISLADTTSGYGLIAAALVLLGYGIGTAMAPATDAIMGVLPEAKMSVGSAINDTTRVAGGALGVAVLGSLLASGYRGDMDSVAGASEVARDSLAGALATGNPQLIAAGQEAFVNGMQTATLVAVGVALVGALIAAVFLPGEKRMPAGKAVPA